MRRAVVAAHGMRHGVNVPEPGLRKGDTGHGAGHQHPLSGFMIVVIGDGLTQVLGDHLDSVQIEPIGDRIGTQGGIGFNRVGQCVHTGSSTDGHRQGNRHVGIQHADIRNDLWAHDRALEVVIIGNHRKWRHFAARAVCGGHTNQVGNPLVHLPHPKVALDIATVRGQHARGLCRIHGTAAPDRDHGIATLGAISPHASLHHGDGGILLYPVVQCIVQ